MERGRRGEKELSWNIDLKTEIYRDTKYNISICTFKIHFYSNFQVFT